MAMAFSLFPEWADRDQFNLAMTLSQTVLEGLAISVQTGAAAEAMVAPMLNLVDDQIRSMNPLLQKASSHARPPTPDAPAKEFVDYRIIPSAALRRGPEFRGSGLHVVATATTHN